MQGKWFKPLIAVVLIVAVSAAGVAYWAWSNGPEKTPRLIKYSSQQVANGERTYMAQCARCHGGNLEGQLNWQTPLPNGRLPAPPQDVSGHTWHHPDSYLFGVTKFGMVPPYAPEGYQSDMPGFGEILSDQEIVDVLLYIKARWPEEALMHQRQVTEEVDGPYVAP